MDRASSASGTKELLYLSSHSLLIVVHNYSLHRASLEYAWPDPGSDFQSLWKTVTHAHACTHTHTQLASLTRTVLPLLTLVWTIWGGNSLIAFISHPSKLLAKLRIACVSVPAKKSAELERLLHTVF